MSVLESLDVFLPLLVWLPSIYVFVCYSITFCFTKNTGQGDGLLT